MVKNSKRESDDRQKMSRSEKGMLILKKWKFLAESYLVYLTNQQNGNPSLLRLVIHHSWSDMRVMALRIYETVPIKHKFNT